MLARQPLPAATPGVRPAFVPQPPLFHEACGRKRAGDDGTDVDCPTPRLMIRLGTAMKRGARPQHRGEIRHRTGY